MLTRSQPLSRLPSGRLTPHTNADVLVTGAAGGLGSIAVAILANRGYRVVASSRRAATHGDYLTSLGAAEVIEGVVEEGAKQRPLDRQRWDGVVDSVGGTTLAAAVAQLKYNGAVASTGVAGGGELHSTVFPFILRGVRLLGVDSTLPWAVDGYHGFQQGNPAASDDWVPYAVAHRAERLRIWDALEVRGARVMVRDTTLASLWAPPLTRPPHPPSARPAGGDGRRD